MIKELFITWFKIGLFTFGGGYAIMPLIKKEIVDKKKWMNQEDILDYYTIGQCTPGIIAINLATFIGYFKKGVIGAIVAVTGMVMPSLIIIILIANILDQLVSIELFKHVLSGIMIAICFLVTNFLISIFKKSFSDYFAYFIASLTFILGFYFKISIYMIMIMSVILIIFYYLVRQKWF